MKEIVKNKEVWLYSFWRTGRTGRDDIVKRKAWISSVENDMICIQALNKHIYRCAKTEGEPYNDHVWYFKENDEEARIAFIRKERQLLDDYKKRVDSHTNRYHILKNAEITLQ